MEKAHINASWVMQLFGVNVMYDDYPVAEPTFLPRKAVAEIAGRLVEKLGLKPGDDLAPAVGALGGKISYQDAWEPSSLGTGSLLVHEAGRFDIILPKDTTYERDRFTISHEIGHYIMHFLWQRANGNKQLSRMKANRYGSDRVEWEANWFAAEFVMPSRPFMELFRKTNGDLAAISSEFNVSYSAAEVRAKYLLLETQ